MDPSHSFEVPVLQRILHPSDFSEASDTAFAHALVAALSRSRDSGGRVHGRGPVAVLAPRLGRSEHESTPGCFSTLTGLAQFAMVQWWLLHRDGTDVLFEESAIVFRTVVLL